MRRILARIPVFLLLGFLATETLVAKSCRTTVHSASPSLDASVELCLKNVPLKFLTHPRFLELASDPDQSNETSAGRISKQSIREAMAALELEWSGRVPGPVKRGDRKKHADFVDGLGNGFDLKAFSSPREKNGEYVDPKFVANEILKKMKWDFVNERTGMQSPIRVYLDLTWLSRKDRKRVLKYLEKILSPEERALLETLELPEPQPRFRRPK